MVTKATRVGGTDGQNKTNCPAGCHTKKAKKSPKKSPKNKNKRIEWIHLPRGYANVLMFWRSNQWPSYTIRRGSSLYGDPCPSCRKRPSFRRKRCTVETAKQRILGKAIKNVQVTVAMAMRMERQRNDGVCCSINGRNKPWKKRRKKLQVSSTEEWSVSAGQRRICQQQRFLSTCQMLRWLAPFRPKGGRGGWAARKESRIIKMRNVTGNSFKKSSTW